jgi:hypothetical protein
MCVSGSINALGISIRICHQVPGDTAQMGGGVAGTFKMNRPLSAVASDLFAHSCCYGEGSSLASSPACEGRAGQAII